MSWAAEKLGVTEETLKMIKAATSGIDTTTGIAGIDILDDIMSWVPVDVPFFESVPRGPGKGATAVMWQTLLNLNGRQTRKPVKTNRAAPIAKIQNQWIYGPYKAIGVGGKVTWTAIAQAQDQATVLAVDTIQTVNQQLINLDIHQLNAQAFGLPEIGTVALTAHSTGGSIATGAVYVRCAARSNFNWYTGGSGAASAATKHVTVTGPSARVTASVPSVKMAAGYDWYVGTSNSNQKYYTTTVVPSVTITTVPTATQKVPTGFAGLYGSYGPTTPITGPASVPSTDTSYTPTCTNGLLATILGDFDSTPDQALVASSIGFVTPGTGISQGAYYANLTGAQLAVSGAAFTQVDEMNRKIYDTYQVTASRMLMGSQVITDFANGFLDNPQAVTWLTPDGKNGKTEALMGGHVATYANKTVNGKPIPLHLMPNLPPGQIVAVIDSLPFPGSGITSALQARTQYDFYRFDYGANRELTTTDGGPRFDFEVRSRQAFVNKASAVCGVIQGIGAGIA